MNRQLAAVGALAVLILCSTPALSLADTPQQLADKYLQMYHTKNKSIIDLMCIESDDQRTREEKIDLWLMFNFDEEANKRYVLDRVKISSITELYAKRSEHVRVLKSGKTLTWSVKPELMLMQYMSETEYGKSLRNPEDLFLGESVIFVGKKSDGGYCLATHVVQLPQ